MCHRFEMLSEEEVAAVVDWLRAVRRVLAGGTNGDGSGVAGVAAVEPPVFGRPLGVPLEALECYPGRESPAVVLEGAGARDAGGLAEEVGMRGAGDLAQVNLVWGIEASWQRGLVFNARIESALAGLGLWREPMESGRCVVPVRAFYETRNREAAAGAGSGRGGAAARAQGAVGDPPELTRGTVADVEQGILGLEDARTAADPRPRGQRPQYRFAATGGTALLLAALRLGDRFALVTCEPDAVVGAVHNRMPLALTAPEALAWLAAADARPLLRRAPVPLTSEEEPASAKAARRPVDPDQMSLF